LEAGSAFGEQAILFDSSTRGATVVASKGSSKEENQGLVILYRLSGKRFRSRLGEEHLATLQDRVKDVLKVFDTLSGVDTKIKEKGTIIRPYDPSAQWLLKQYRGTVLQYIGPTVLAMVSSSLMPRGCSGNKCRHHGLPIYPSSLQMTFAAVFGVLVEHFGVKINGDRLGFMMGIDADPTPGSVLWHLELITGTWKLLTPLTTFVATFFLNSAFKFWNRFYWTTRGIQGRFNDISLILASYAARDDDGGITQGAKQVLDDVSRLQRLLHQLYWSVVVKRFNSLHSPVGLSYLLSFRLVTEDEYDSLVSVAANHLGVHHASMLFMTSRIVLAKEKGEIKLDTTANQEMLDKITNLRMLMARIPVRIVKAF